MAHNVESLFSVRETPWHGLGQVLPESPTSEDAIRHAGLDWKVNQEPVFLKDGALVPNVVANVRETDQSILGTVSDRYQVIQNSQAFSFMDELMGEGIRYETAGSLRGGKWVWMLVKAEEQRIILDDAVDQYIVLFNSHDGSTGLKVALSPIRVVCNNTLNLALHTASRTFTAKHTFSINSRMAEASRVLKLNNSYISTLEEEAEAMAKIRLSEFQFKRFTELVFPYDEEASDLTKRRADENRSELLARYFEAPDLANHRGTAWGAFNAITDYAGHTEPTRNTPTFQENRFINLVDKPNFINHSMNVLKSMIA